MSPASRRFLPTLSLLCLPVLAAGCRRQETGAAPISAPAGEPVAFAATNPGPAPAKDVTPRVNVPPVAEQLTEAFANAAQAIRPSVVRIDVEISRQAAAGRTRGEEEPENQDIPDFLRRFFDFGGRGQGIPGLPAPSQAPVRGTGSGVIIDTQGHIVTNAHVVENAQKVTISLVDGRKVTGKVLGRDPLTDV